MAWIKRATDTPPTAEEIVEDILAAKAEAAAKEPQTAEEPAADTAPAASRRFSKRGFRRGQRTGTAILGFVVLFFAVIGMISTVVTGIHVVRTMRDTSHLTEEMYYTVRPLAQYTPKAFEAVDKADQAPLIQAALYAVTNREWIRQQQDPNYETPYEIDDFGRTIVPIADVTEAYHALFGDEFTPQYTTFGVEGDSYFSFEYEEDKKHYHVPQQSSGAFEPVVGTIRRAGDTYIVQVGYVHLQDVTVDDHGNQVVDIEKSTYFQLFTVEKVADEQYVITAVADEKTGK